MGCLLLCQVIIIQIDRRNSFYEICLENSFEGHGCQAFVNLVSRNFQKVHCSQLQIFFWNKGAAAACPFSQLVFNAAPDPERAVRLNSQADTDPVCPGKGYAVNVVCQLIWVFLDNVYGVGAVKFVDFYCRRKVYVQV